MGYEYETEQQLIDKIQIKTWDDGYHTNAEASLILVSGTILDPFLLHSRSHAIEEIVKILQNNIVNMMHTKELELELQRLRAIEQEHYKCPTPFYHKEFGR